MEPRATGRRDELPEGSRYELLVKLASGGMATVYVGRSTATVSRLFAIKRAHAHLVDDPVFRRMFVIEGRLAAGIHHPNVVSVQDVVELPDELLLVMDYVEGLALVDMDIEDARTRVSVASRVVLDVCAGLHAAHELMGDDGELLDIVHRDVSPHNILVGIDGVARITDFGIAKSGMATSNATVTGALKGKLAYMAPEYIESGRADRRADVYALGVVLWEALTGSRLFRAGSEIELMKLVLNGPIDPPSSRTPSVPAELDAVVAKALTRDPDARFPTADALAAALEEATRVTSVLASHRDVAMAVEREAHEMLRARRDALRVRTNREPEPVIDEPIAEPERTETLAPRAAPTPAPALTTPAPRANQGRMVIAGVGLLLLGALAILAFRPAETPVVDARTDPSASVVARALPEGPTAPTSERPAAPSAGALASTSLVGAVPHVSLVRVPSPAPGTQGTPSAAAIPGTRPQAPSPGTSTSTTPTPSIAPPNPYVRDASPVP